MNRKPKDPRYQLHRISKAFVEDLLKTPDDEILAEAAQNNSSKNPGEAAKAAYSRALQATGQKRLQAARDAMQKKSEGADLPMNMDVQRARQLLAKIAANDPEFSPKITLAARNLKDLADSDVLEIIGDLQRLGAFPKDGQL
jgi:hypothetical protein